MKHQEVLRVNQLGKVYRSRSVIVGMPVGSAAGFLIAGAQEGFEDDRHRPQQKPKGREPPKIRPRIPHTRTVPKSTSTYAAK